MVVPPLAGQEDKYQSNPAIGREEKDQLWSMLPEVHLAALNLLQSMVQRLGRNILPMARDMIDHLVRIYASTRDAALARKVAFVFAKEVLLVTGPTLDRMTVESLSLIIQGCCRDLLDAADYTEAPNQEHVPATNGNKDKGSSVSNADAFLAPQSKTSTASIIKHTYHLAEAEELLPIFLSHLPQKNLSPESRGLIDRTAILCGIKSAMLASCMFPYKDSNGRYYPSILPFLVRQFPHDSEVEVLRSNLRSARLPNHGSWNPEQGLGELLKEPDLMPSHQRHEDQRKAEESPPQDKLLGNSNIGLDADVEMIPPVEENSFALFSSADVQVVQSDRVADQPPVSDLSTSTSLKRKTEDVDVGPSKRLEKGKEVDVAVQLASSRHGNEDGDSDSDSEKSVQIDMTFDDDEDEEDDEEE
jgi:hypothetical protein